MTPQNQKEKMQFLNYQSLSEIYCAVCKDKVIIEETNNLKFICYCPNSNCINGLLKYKIPYKVAIIELERVDE